jgi:hypothetical protein
VDGQLWSAYDKLATEPGLLLLRLFKPAKQRPSKAGAAP